MTDFYEDFSYCFGVPCNEIPFYIFYIVKNSKFNVDDCIKLAAFCFGHSVTIDEIFPYLWFMNDAVGEDYELLIKHRLCEYYKNFWMFESLRRGYYYWDVYLKAYRDLNGDPVDISRLRGHG